MERDEPQQVPSVLEASLAVRVEVAGGRIERVSIGGGRPVRAASVLEGRPVESALALIPRLYRLCGTAQSVAALRAVEAAFDRAPGPSGSAARSVLVACESLEQTLWRILLDWPRCTGGQPDERALKRLRKHLAQLQRGVFADSRWVRPGGARVNGLAAALSDIADSLTRDVDELLFDGASGDEVLRSRGSFDGWLRSTRNETAAVFDWVVSNQLEGFGGAGIGSANGFDTAYIADRISRDDSWAFCGRPDHRGDVPQTGALERLANAPLVRELRGEYGHGLSTQLTARLLEVPSLLSDIRTQIRELAPEEAAEFPAICSGRALGSVDTARGRLFHWVEVSDGRIARYRTLAPTEWNFHPRGPLALGLGGAPAGDLALTRRAVDLLVTAIDPCIGTQLEVAEA